VNDRLSSEQRLAAVRVLIEQRDRYRATFARIALVAGTLSMLLAAVTFVNDEVMRFLGHLVRAREFAFAWLVVLLLTASLAASLCRREPREAGQILAATPLKLALANVAPLLIIPAAFTGWFFSTGYLGGTELDLVVIWIAFYGLMLLSSGLFAPRAILLLGWAFLLSALAVPLVEDKLDLWIGSVPTVAMGVTFGVYHLLYAGLNWRRAP
jgi:magnesium-transporting ATPase (P-type)